LEQELRGKSEAGSSNAGSSFLSPVNAMVMGVGQSPDSGIEFDRWTPGTGE
jgi:hypothetical protein